MRSLLVVAGLTIPRIAAADAVVPADAAHSPGFVQIDRYDGTSVAGADVTFVKIDDSVTDDVTLLRFQLGGRFLDKASGFGGYVNLPITYASGNDDSTTGIGNIEVGGLMLTKLGDESTRLVLHGGITIPSANGTDDDGSFANAFGSLARPQDVYLAAPKGTTLRFGASPLYRNGNVFGRVDLGIDINLDADGSGDNDPIVHLNAGVGVDLGNVALMGELSNVYIFSDGDGDLADRLINVMALSARFDAGTVFPYVSLMIPLDDNSSTAVDLAVTAGLEAKL